MVFYSPINHTSSKKTKQKQHRMVILLHFLLLLFRHILRLCTIMNENSFTRHSYQSTAQVTEGRRGDIKWKIQLYFHTSKKI